MVHTEVDLRIHLRQSRVVTWIHDLGPNTNKDTDGALLEKILDCPFRS